MKKDYPRFTLRVSKELLEKVRYVADMNGRTMNREIEMIVKRYIADYERLYGKVSLDRQPQSRQNEEER